MALDLALWTRRFAWGFGIAGLLIPLAIEAAWRLGWMEQVIPHYLLEWVIVVWPWSWLLIYAEDAGLLLSLFVLTIAVVLNVLLYAAVGAVIGALLGLAARRPS